MKLELSPKTKNILEWIYCIIIAIILALVVKYFIGTPTLVQQPSMNNTLAEGQRLILSRLTRTFKGKYNRGDIITFEAPTVSKVSLSNLDQENPIAVYSYEPTNLLEKFNYYILEISKISYIKRVIGIEGDQIKIADGKVYLNGEELQEDYIAEGAVTLSDRYTDITVPEGYVFVMGDNREHSTDSRSFGCIPVEKIESKVWIRFWPLTKFGKV